MNFFAKGREPAWRRAEQQRARQQREDQEDQRRARAGLPPRPTPDDGSARFHSWGSGRDTSTGFTTGYWSPNQSVMVSPGMGYADNNGLTYYNMGGQTITIPITQWQAISQQGTISIGSGMATASPIPAPDRPEPVPSLRDLWRD